MRYNVGNIVSWTTSSVKLCECNVIFHVDQHKYILIEKKSLTKLHLAFFKYFFIIQFIEFNRTLCMYVYRIFFFLSFFSPTKGTEIGMEQRIRKEKI